MIAQKMMIAVEALGEGHRQRADGVAEQAEHVGPLAADQVADLAADEDERGRDQRLERDRRLDAADRRVEVLDDRRDRHVHQRRVDDEDEHRHRQEQAESSGGRRHPRRVFDRGLSHLAPHPCWRPTPRGARPVRSPVLRPVCRSASMRRPPPGVGFDHGGRRPSVRPAPHPARARSRHSRRSGCTWRTTSSPCGARRSSRPTTRTPPIPFWAFAWGGGLAIGRYLGEHPEVVAGRRVFDLAPGPGCARSRPCGPVPRRRPRPTSIRSRSRRSGSTPTRMADRVATVGRDVLDEAPPDAEVILAGDCWYDAGLARRVLPWLRRAVDAGHRRPGRRPWPGAPAGRRPGRAGSYEVRTTSDLEDLALKTGRVFRLRAGSRAAGHDRRAQGDRRGRL